MNLKQTTERLFAEQFGYSARLSVRAPGRVNLIGEHTDYNDGFVLPCAINYHTVISAAARDDRRVRVIAADYANQRDEFSLDAEIEHHPDFPWANYVRGVVKYLQQLLPPSSLPPSSSDGHLGGADLLISGNVPQGAGLSSSASLEVAVGKTLQQLWQLPVDDVQLALNGQRAENLFVGCNCGIMDQLISAKASAGNALLIDCRSLASTAVPLPQGAAVVIINSNFKRTLVSSEYNTRRQQCEQGARFFGKAALRDVSLAEFEAQAARLDPLVAKRVRHVISENARTLAAVDALAAGDLPRMGELMAQSHCSMRDDFDITVPQIDTLVDIIKTCIGGHGGVRMTGGGFGGCVVALIPQALAGEVRQAVASHYQAKTGIKETFYLCQPSSGASLC